MLQFDKWKIGFVGMICGLGLLMALPNLFDRQTIDDLPDWMPFAQVNLGLDLQGGSHLLLEVQVGAILKERLEGLVDSSRSILRKAQVGYRGLGVKDEAAVFTLRQPTQWSKVSSQINALGKTGGILGGANTLDVTVDGTDVALRFTEKAQKDMIRNAVGQSIEIVRRRIDETGTREPTIQRQGDDRILVQLPGVQDPDRVKNLLGRTARLTMHMVDTSTTAAAARRGRMPPGTRLLPSDELDRTGRPLQLLVKRRVAVSGDHLVDAQPSFQDGRPVVSFRFDTRGGQKFAKITKENVGEILAIVLDGRVVSAPRIRSPIVGGSGIIEGGFTVQEVHDLSLLLRAGALPAPLTVLEERTVGPGLGADSVAAGKIASLFGLVLVALFMAVAYGRFGLLADFALAVNIILILAALSVLQATLTLPGIAGIVLTMGMAVDANVLVFERIREETRLGRTPLSAVDAGYKRAYTTIIDSNLTTLIAALLLYFFGSGPVRGFAVTLSIGIVTSLFTAIMVTRMMVVIWLRRTRPDTLPL